MTGGSYVINGQAGVVGPGTRAEHLHFSQVWDRSRDSIDLAALAGELARLRSEMRRISGGSLEEDIALSNLAQAEAAARKDDGSAVMTHLAQAGKSALDVAKQMGAQLAVKSIEAAMNKP